ncbi:MAG: PQQ-binding-like beta-propeller repeat protein [Thermoanaerobaculia bacterium]
MSIRDPFPPMPIKSTLSGPVRIDNTLIFIDCVDPMVGTLHARNLTNGTDDWTYKLGTAVWSTPVVAHNTIYVGGQNCLFHAIDLQKGTRRWDFPTGGRPFSSPAVAGDSILVSLTNGELLAIASNGQERWRHRPLQKATFGSRPVVDGDAAVYVVNESKENLTKKWATAYKVDLKSGRRLWSYPVLDTSMDLMAAPCTGAGAVYLPFTNGTLHAVEWSDGHKRWTFKAQAAIRSAPAFGAGMVCFGSEDRALYGIKADDGKRSRGIAETNAIRNDVVIADGMIYYDVAASPHYYGQMVLDGDWSVAYCRSPSLAGFSTNFSLLDQNLYVSVWGTESLLFGLSYEEGLKRFTAERPVAPTRDEGTHPYGAASAVTITVLDRHAKPMPKQNVEVWADAPVLITCWGQTYHVNPKERATLLTNGEGKLEISIQPQSAPEPNLFVWADFLPGDGHIVVPATVPKGKGGRAA